MKLFRTVLFWTHLIIGVSAAVIVVIMSITGVLLTYQKQITNWADLRVVRDQLGPTSAPRLSTEEMLSRAAVSAGASPTAVTLRADPNRPADVSFGRERRELVNVYTGAILGQGSTGVRDFFRLITAWHRTLGVTGEKRALARQLTGAANLGFFILVISGFYLWWPRNWTSAAVRNVTVFRRGLGGKARDFNWHNVIGFWSALPLVFVVASGVVISYRWAGNLVYRSVGEKPPAATPAPAPNAGGKRDEDPVSAAGLNALLESAKQRVPHWKSITVQFPTAKAKVMTFAIDAGTGGQPQLRSQVTLDRATGRETKWEPFASQTPGRRLRSILRFAHTGEVLGIPGQTVAGLVSFGAVVLAITGLMLSFRRLASWIQRQRRLSFTHKPMPTTS